MYEYLVSHIGSSTSGAAYVSNILIAGLHKTGTTGLYTALRSAVPGAGHFFLFEPKSPEPLLALGRYAPYHSIVVKILINRVDDCAIRYGDFDRRVMMVRDPRDMVVSRLLFRPMFGWTSYRINVNDLQPFIRALQEKEADPKSHSVKDLHDLADRIGISKSSWPQLAQQMSRKMQLIDDEDFFVLRYEDFIDNRLEAASDYLGVPVRNQQAADDGWTSHIQRSMGYGDWKHWFLDEDAEFFGEMFATYMSRFGYQEWERAADPQIDPATSSGYIAGPTTERIIDRQNREHTAWAPAQVQTQQELRQLISMAEDGRALWAYRLARLYSEDTAFGPDEQQALRWARHGARLGHAKAMSLCAALLQQTGDADGDAVLEARFWQRESDRLTGRQRTQVSRGRRSTQTEDTGSPASEKKKRVSSDPSNSHGAPAPVPSRRIVSRIHGQLQPLLTSTVRDSPHNARLVLRSTARTMKRRLQRRVRHTRQ